MALPNGWENPAPGSNDTNTYSSEFTASDGNRFAVVVNKATGQRQLYFVNKLTRGRSLLVTTNSDGSKLFGGQQFVDNGTLTVNQIDNADNLAKQSSIVLLESDEVTSREEKEKLGETEEYKKLDNTDNTPEETNTTDAEPKPAQVISPGILIYPIDMKPDQDRIKFIAIEYRPSGFGQTKHDRKTVPVEGGGVYLPIQSGIVDQNGVVWSPGELNELTKTALGFGMDIIGLSNTLSDNIPGIYANKIQSLASEAKTGSETTTAALAQYIFGLQNLLGRTGQILNPNLELLFSAPKLRPFQFRFQLSPRNKIEADRVKKIIKYFKKNMAVKKGTSDLFLKAPNTFFIQYQKSANDIDIHPSINKIKECALTDFNVDYTPMNTYMTYDDDDHTMVSYGLTMQFQELDPIYYEDYDDHPIGY